jgi:hypothetical protein
MLAAGAAHSTADTHTTDAAAPSAPHRILKSLPGATRRCRRVAGRASAGWQEELCTYAGAAATPLRAMISRLEG